MCTSLEYKLSRHALWIFSLFWVLLPCTFAADFTVRENAGQLEVRMDFLQDGTCQRQAGCSVSVSTADGTAVSGVDYESTTQTLSWGFGDGGSKPFVVNIIDNATNDGNRAFSLNAQDETGIVLTARTRSVEIIDDETTEAPGSSGSIEAPARVVETVIDTVCPQIQNVASAEGQALREDCNAIINAKQNDDPLVINALTEIAPDQAAAAVGVGQQTINTQIRNISSRMTAVRNNNRTAFNGLNIHIDDETLAVAELLTGGAAGDELSDGQLGVFVNGELSFGGRDNTTREEGYDFSTTGLTAGVDFRMNPALVVGAALGFAVSSSEFDSNGSLDSTGILATLFASWQKDRIFVDGGISLGKNDYEQDRKIKYTLSDGTDVDQTVKSSFGGNENSVFINSGLEMLLPSKITLLPQFRFEYVKSDVDGFTENDASSRGDWGEGWRVKMEDQSSSRLLVSLGAKATKAISSESRVWVPYAGFEWIQDFKAEKTDAKGQFIGDPTNETFVLESDAPDDSFFRLNIGTTAVFQSGKSAFVDFSTMLGMAHESIYSLNFGYRWEF